MRLTRRIFPLAVAAALVGAAPATALEALGTTRYMGASADGSHVYFRTSKALVAADTDSSTDLYVRANGVAALVTPGDRSSHVSSLDAVAADGSVALFSTSAQLVAADTDSASDVYARSASGLRRVTQGNAEAAETLAGASADGSTAYITTTLALDPADQDGVQDVYGVDTASGAISLVSTGSAAKSAGFVGAGGSRVFFSTTEPLVAADTDALTDVYFRDGGATGLATEGTDSNTVSARAVAPDGSRLLFTTFEQLVAADVDSASDLYEAGPSGTKLRSPSTNAAAAAKSVTLDAVSADGTRVVFHTTEPLSGVDGDTTVDLYAHTGSSIVLLSGLGSSEVEFEDASADAQLVLFTTADQLTATDTDHVDDVYRAGAAGGLAHIAQANGPHTQVTPMVSSPGTLIAFQTDEALTGADSDTLHDVYARVVSPQLASFRSGFSEAGPASGVQLEAVTGANAVLFSGTDRLTADDGNDAKDVYSYSGGQLVRVSADTFAPDTTLAGVPETAGDGASVTPVATATEPGSRECRLDGGAWEPCGATYGPLAPGAHTVEARATDDDGNVDPSPASATLTVMGPQGAEQAGGQAVGSGVADPGATVAAGATSTTAADRTAPRVARLRITRRAARLRIAFAIDEAATARVLVQRRAGAAWRTVRARRVLTAAGTAAVRIKVAVRPGMRVRVLARDAAGNASTPVARRLRG